ncbi:MULTISPECIES: hypothetical protein [Vibrio]|uniref:hypothetical protein n=1 Tax=Vibrio TaxID=662 RepID=UPI0010BDFD17|nr:hypothetical protein [Vibrio sp. F12]TKE87546.1 hypothetical protein FCV54_01380 [Vibrio sp. F12]CAK3815953.1 conserved exported hypothetical protein [Vibrio crassostreae]
MYQLLLVTMLFASQVVAAIDCVGKPVSVIMGDYGRQEDYVIVHISGLEYRLGVPSDDKTKARLSLAQTALVADKRLKLKFYAADTCEKAANERVIPNSVQLLK